MLIAYLAFARVIGHSDPRLSAAVRSQHAPTRGLIAGFVLLIAVDLWGVSEVWRLIFDHSHHAGGAFWVAFAFVVLLYVGLIWFIVRVGRRLRAPADADASAPN